MMTASQLRAWLASPEYGRAVDAIRALATKLRRGYVPGVPSWQTRHLRSSAHILIYARKKAGAR